MKPRVFVVMPFGVKEVRAASDGQPAASVDFNAVYEQLLKPALLEAGCAPFRADEEAGVGDIRTDMFFELVTADAVLADLSILNPNVFYELGVRHGVAPGGAFLVHADWTRRPFDVAPDRTFGYDGTLFVTGGEAADGGKLRAQVEALARKLRAAVDCEDRTVASPVYKELQGLRPVDWSAIQTARARYFGGILDEWRDRLEVARRNGYPGDILTLADDAPTRLHQNRLLLAAARALIDLDRLPAARDVLGRILDTEPEHLDARCQIGLVLSRLGDGNEAQVHMQRVVREHAGEPEAQAILGSVYKGLWRLRWQDAPTTEDRQRKAMASAGYAVSALNSYAAVLRDHPGEYYNGINVVSMASLLEHLAAVTRRPLPAGARRDDLADLIAVVRFAANGARERALAGHTDADHAGFVWATATLAELELLQGSNDAASLLYEEAANAPGAAYSRVISMRRQVALFESLGFCPSGVGQALAVLDDGLSRLPKPGEPFRNVVLCSGHMIDAPDRAAPRFPPGKEPAVRARLEAQLDAWDVGPGDLAISGAARGADILFAELCRERGATVRLYVALSEPEYLKESVRLRGDDRWERRYFDLRRDPQVETAFMHERIGPPPEGMSVFERANVWMIHTASAENRTGELCAALIWDEKPTGDGPGGTSDFAARVLRLGGRLGVINPTEL